MQACHLYNSASYRRIFIHIFIIILKLKRTLFKLPVFPILPYLNYHCALYRSEILNLFLNDPACYY